ncbi:MAG TPA: TRAP transporter substrate-binding protein DctP [Kofleriaceae bacterium]|nr:TRAP transporter substrate-binding protein DctP [Kofleriaceae bacterium]
MNYNNKLPVNLAKRSTFVVAATLISGTLAASQAHADNVELRIATLAPAGSKWMQVLDKGAAEIAKETTDKNPDGTPKAGAVPRVTLKYYPGGEQGDEKDFIRKINLGQLDGAAITATGLSLIDESIRVLELPMMFDNVAEFDAVADQMWPTFQSRFEKKGFKLNDRGEVGWIYFISKNKISSIADLKNQKAWLWGDDNLVKAMYAKLGVSGVPLGVPEVDPALTSGRVNAAYGSPLASVALQWYAKVKFMTSMPMSYAIGATVVSIKSLEKIGADDQKALTKVAKGLGKKLRTAIRSENESAKKTMVRKGVTIVETPTAMVDEFRKNAQEVWTSLAGKMYSKEDLALMLKYRDAYRAKHPPKAAAPAAAPAPAPAK